VKLGFEQEQHRCRYRSLTLTQVNTVMTSWFYWSEAERTVKGEDLATCLHLYDTGGERDDDRDLETQLVFLDETRSTGYSWLLTFTVTGTLVPVLLYEAHPNTLKALGAPPRVLGW
jgi:hypothetical protein